MIKSTVLTGVQPTNKLTLGNYIGSLLNLTRQQDQYNCVFFIADWHSLTTLILTDNIQVLKSKNNLVRWAIASGIDPEKTLIFNQSDVPEHLELFYILMIHTNTGELSRMTQYKDIISKLKQDNNTYISPTSILLYPVLMAADILIHDADLIPVGEDQKQHIELCRNIAERFNKKYNTEIFKIPTAIIPQYGARIRDLQDPTKKMSKSYTSSTGTIFLSDNKEEVNNKIMKSKTDNLNKINYDFEKQPGISNLIQICCSLNNITPELFLSKHSEISYLNLKKLTSDIVNQHLSLLQLKYNNLTDEKINQILKTGASRAQLITSKKIKIIKKLLF